MQDPQSSIKLLVFTSKLYSKISSLMSMNRLLTIFLLFISCFTMSSKASAHIGKNNLVNVEVQGKVTNDKNEPLVDVSITIKGKQRGVLTNTMGLYKIQADENDVLVFSYVGFVSQTFPLKSVTNKKGLNVKLIQSVEMNEVIVIGTQSQSKRTTTSSVSSVLAREIENIPSPSVDALLQGRVAGLNVQVGSGEPGVSPTVVVRGNTRVNKNIGDPDVAQAQALSSPLYVIDGVPVNPSDIANNIDATGTNYLAGINVNDIESVIVQKDAAATAAWGSQGANGVIYITTKKGRSKTPEFRVNVYDGISTIPPLLPTLVGNEERRQKLNLIDQYAVTAAQRALIPQILTDSMNPYYNNATDWQGLFYQQGTVKNIDATVSAASDNFNYRVSMNYYDEKGIIKQFGFKRYSLRGSFNFKLSSKLNAQFIIAMSKSDRQRGMKYNDNSDENTPISGSSMPASFYKLTAFDSANFTGLYSKIRNKNVNDIYSASFTLNYNINPMLKYTFQGSTNISTSNRDYFKPSNINQVAALGGIAQPSSVRSDKGTFSTYFMSNSLNFNKRLKSTNHAHTFAVTGTQQFTANVSNTNYVGGTNTPSNDIQVVSGVPQANLYGGSGYAADGLLSIAGQVQYDLDSKYLLYASYRGDASSRFGNDSKWGYFPSVGTGWVLSDEKFMQGSKKYISFFKVRASFGVSGNRSSNFYAPYNQYVIPGTYGGSTAIQPSYTNGLTKDNLTWAKVEQKNIGADIQLFNSRVNISLDIYDKISKDDYYDFRLPFYTGFSSIEFNARDLWVSNRGMDLTISANVLPNKSNLRWNTQLTLSHNKNAFAKLPNQNRTFVISDAYGVGRIFAVGQPVYEMFQMIYAGVYNNKSEIPFNRLTGAPITYFKGNHPVVPGDPIWLDINNIGDVWSDADNGNQYGNRTPSGDPNPLFTGGWVNDFTYKNFSLSIVSVFTYKRTIINTYRQQQFNNFGGNITNFANNKLPNLDGINYWTPTAAAKDPNYQANFPSLTPFGGYFYQFFPFSTMFNEDGSYFKIKNIILGYQVNKNIVKKIGLSSARIYGIVDNVLTIKNSSMANPELVDQLGNYVGGAYPVPTKFTFGIDIQF